MNRITLLTNSSGQVLARFFGPHTDRIVGMFGTDTVPTAFSFNNNTVNSDKQRESIRRQIAAMNVGAIVAWEAR